MNKREKEIREKLGVTERAPAKEKMTPEGASEFGNKIRDMAIGKGKRKAKRRNAMMPPQMMTGDPNGMELELAGATAGITITPKQIGRVTINAPIQAKKIARSIEKNTQKKGEVEKVDN